MAKQKFNVLWVFFRRNFHVGSEYSVTSDRHSFSLFPTSLIGLRSFIIIFLQVFLQTMCICSSFRFRFSLLLLLLILVWFSALTIQFDYKAPSTDRVRSWTIWLSCGYFRNSKQQCLTIFLNNLTTSSNILFLCSAFRWFLKKKTVSFVLKTA